MDTTAGLGFRHTLYTMHTAFIFHFGVSALTDDHKLYFLHAADTDLVHVQGFHLPALTLRIMNIKAIHFRRKEGCLVPACTCTDFHDYILVIIRVLGKQENLQLLLQLLHTLLGAAQFLLEHFAHVIIGLLLQHGKGILNILLGFLVLLVGLHDGS